MHSYRLDDLMTRHHFRDTGFTEANVEYVNSIGFTCYDSVK